MQTATVERVNFGGFDNLPILGPASPAARTLPPRPAGEVRSLQETADFFHVSVPTIKAWIKDGCPVVERGSNGVAYKLELEAVHRWRQAKSATEAQEDEARRARDRQLELELLGGQSVDGQFEGLSPAQRIAAIDAEWRATKLAEKRGELVNAAELAVAMTRVAGMVRDRLSGLPDELEKQVGLDQDQVEAAILVVDEALEDLSAELSGLGRTLREESFVAAAE